MNHEAVNRCRVGEGNVKKWQRLSVYLCLICTKPLHSVRPSVGTPGPATGALFTFEQIFFQTPEVFLSGLFLLHDSHITNPLISREGSESVPEFQNVWIFREHFLKVLWYCMDDACGNFLHTIYFFHRASRGIGLVASHAKIPFIPAFFISCMQNACIFSGVSISGGFKNSPSL